MNMDDPMAIRLIKQKIRFAHIHGGNSRVLTANDGIEIDLALERCCANGLCDRAQECDELNNRLSELLPAYKLVPTEHANAKSKVQRPSRGDWIPQLYSRPIFQRARERMYC